MTCPHCQAPFSVKAKFLAKTGGGDEDERFLNFEDWSFTIVGISIYDLI